MATASLAADRTLPPEFEAYAAEELAQSPAGAVGKAGSLDMRFARGSDGNSRLVYDRATVPFHLTGGLYHDEAMPDIATAYVQDPTGGIAQGDRYEASIQVESDAKAHVSTGSATKVLRMERNYGASHVELDVASNGYLEYLPDPTILHRDARYLQTVEVSVAPDAVALFADVVVSGRLARDEAFEFDRFHASVEATSEGTDLFADAVRLDGDDSLRGPGMFGEFRVVGTFYVVAPGHEAVGEFADELHDCVQATEGDRADAAVGGASVLPREAGVVVRVLGDRTSDVTDRFTRAWDCARQTLVGANAPDTRKF